MYAEMTKKRSTRYSGDYQQRFTDLADISDSDSDAAPSARPAGKTKKVVVKKGARQKECPGCGVKVGISIRECSFCDYTFTSRSMLVVSSTAAEESSTVRSRFLFEPERDEDGSLMIERLVGRRLRKDKARNFRKNSQFVTLTAEQSKYDYEYLVKYKTLSFLHVQWLSAHEIDTMSMRSKQVLTRYLRAVDAGTGTVQEDGEIDPTFVEVEKILDVREEEVFDVQDEVRRPAEETTMDVDQAEAAAVLMSSASNVGESTSSGMVDTKGGSSATGIVGEVQQQKFDPVTGEPIVLSVGAVFRHNERCRRVLDRICEDPFASSFIEPVDTDLYDDYLDVVDQPMSLSDVRERLEAGEYKKYQGYMRFAQDMRLIWVNCKSYNLYKSQIWHSAHALSMLFERLYQAWISSFSDGSISMEQPIGCPWDADCRICTIAENEGSMVLCDHCDAAFHLYCLKPPLKEVPEGSWFCDRCEKWFVGHPMAKRLAATLEEEARDNTTKANERIVVKTRKRKYLVKWRGLCYGDSTWETAKDINDDEKIRQYHLQNDAPPEEPPLTRTELDLELRKDRAKPALPAFQPGHHFNLTTETDAQLYAQIRAYHFIKSNQNPTTGILKESGPWSNMYTHGGRLPMTVPRDVADVISQIKANASSFSTSSSSSSSSSSSASGLLQGRSDTAPANDDKKRRDLNPVRLPPPRPCIDSIKSEVAITLTTMLTSLGRNVPMPSHPQRPQLPPQDNGMPSEIEVVVPRGMPLGFTAANVAGRLCVKDWLPVPGSVRLCQRVKLGDYLTAINGVSVVDFKYAQVLDILKQVNTPYLYLRFLRTSEQGGVLGAQVRASARSKRTPGVSRTEELDPEVDIYRRYLNQRNWDPKPSYLPPPARSVYFGVFPSEAVGEEGKWTASYFIRPANRTAVQPVNPETPDVSVLAALRTLAKQSSSEVIVGVFSTELEAAKARDASMRTAVATDKSVAVDETQFNFNTDGGVTKLAQVLARVVMQERAEGAAALERHLQDSRRDKSAMDVDVAKSKAKSAAKKDKKSKSIKEELNDREQDEMEWRSLDSCDSDSDQSGDEDFENEYEGNPKEQSKQLDGPFTRLHRAVVEANDLPIRSEWTDYIKDCCSRPDTRGFERPRQIPGKPREGVPVDQLDSVSGRLIRRWKSANAAATGLVITQYSINNCCQLKVESAGGFRFRYSTEPFDAKSAEAFADDLDDIDDRGAHEDAWKLKLHKKSKEYRSGGTLRDYQLEGLNWLLRCWYRKRSSILADEMGLGKTVQVVSFLDHIFEVENVKGPFLICVPLSTLEHWKRECETWSHMAVNVYHDTGGGRDMRDIIREYEWYYKGRSRRLLKFHVLITTYDDLIRDYEELAEIAWRVVVVDEAHRLRNSNSRLLECMRSVVSKGLTAFGYQHRVLMTGTPLQNNTDELWSLLNFIEPSRFPDFDKFKKQYGEIKTQEQVLKLQHRLAPHLLRRVKEDVAKDIPPKEETIIDVELTTTQKQYYRAIYEHNHGYLMQAVKGTMPKLMNIQMELRKVCNHPWLVGGVEDAEMEKVEAELSPATRANIGVITSNTATSNRRKATTPAHKEYLDKRMRAFVPMSGKMVLLDKLLPKLKREGHKVLIFSQMVKMIDFIEEYCDWRDYSCERLDGRVSGNDRQKGIDRFNRDPDSFIFLLSTRAGGVGITLTAADTCIIFDSDWNPQNDVQAMARCHRIGQKKSVTVYRLITRKCFEAEMFDRASKKLGLEQAILGTRQFLDSEFESNEANKVKMDAKEMEQLLREGAYAVFTDEDEEDVREFCEQDIDMILEQRAHLLVSDTGAPTESAFNKKKGNKARKSFFTGAESMEHADIDVNDPDFWAKVLPDLVTPDSMWTQLQGFDEEEDVKPSVCRKFYKDMAVMMEGMVDLVRRNQMPDNERDVCVSLLLRVTLRPTHFEESERFQAQEWLTVIEGTRQRRGRTDVYDTHRIAAEERKRAEMIKRKQYGTGKKKAEPGGPEDADGADDNVDMDEDDSEDDDDDDDDGDGDGTAKSDDEGKKRSRFGARGPYKKRERKAGPPRERKPKDPNNPVKRVRPAKRSSGDSGFAFDDEEADGPKAKRSRSKKEKPIVAFAGGDEWLDDPQDKVKKAKPIYDDEDDWDGAPEYVPKKSRGGPVGSQPSRDLQLRQEILRGQRADTQTQAQGVEEDDEEDPYAATNEDDVFI